MLIQNATLCDHSKRLKADIRTQNGIITQIGDLEACNSENVIDLNNKILMPAMIDFNLSPLNRTLSTQALLDIAQKSIKGGVGTILLSPDTTPQCTQPTSIELIQSINEKSIIHFLASIAPLDACHKLSDIAILHAKGGCAISTQSDIESNTLLRIAQYAQMLQIPLICFCQDRILADGVMNEGYLSTALGLPPIPQYSQTKEVAKVIEMLQNLPIDIVLHALAYPRNFEILSSLTQHTQAKFHPQVSIHHLILDETLCANYNTAGKINPPLIHKDEQNKLMQALKNGSIRLLTSLQSAISPSQKNDVFELAGFGIDALEDYFSLLYTSLHLECQIPLQDISALTSFHPAQILNLNKGSLEVGKEAEFVVIDPHHTYTITDTLSPYYGKTLRSKVEALITHESLHTHI